MSGPRHYDQDKDSTLYVGNLDERCTDALVWELMLQAGPIINVHLPKDRVTQSHQGYGFVEFGSEEDADYAAKIMNQIRIWGKPIRVNKASADKRGGPGGGGAGAEGLGGGQGVGAELFVGNLDSMVDERVLFETFSRFGPLLAPPKLARDEATNLNKGYGFISYASFEASDDAIANMHGQYLMNKEVVVQYAYKKDGKGERHGDAAERALAAQAVKHGVSIQAPTMPASLTGANALAGVVPTGPSAFTGGFAAAPANGGAGLGARTPQPPPSYNYAPYGQGPPGGGGGGGYSAMAPPPGAPPQFNGAPPGGMPNRAYNQSPLQAPPTAAGLPARPPPSMAGYGGPAAAAGMQQNFAGPPPGFAPPGAPPAGFAPPPGVGGPPPGFRPPGVPNGYQQR